MADQDVDRQLMLLTERLDAALAACDFDGVRTLLLDYTACDYYTPKYCLPKLEQALSHQALADLVVELTTIGIQRNTPAALERFYPGMGTPVKVAGLFKDLYSQRGWAKWKLGDEDGARCDLRTAIQYYEQWARPTEYGKITLSAADLLRLAVTAQDPDSGWTKLKQSIILDSEVLSSDFAYVRGATNIIRSRLGPSTDITTAVADILSEQQNSVPAVGMADLKGAAVPWSATDRPTLLVFFNPACGSCQQELRAIAPLHAQVAALGRLVLVLNQPTRQVEAERLLHGLGLPEAAVAVLLSGSSYSHIPAEPTTWLIDREATIRYRSVGYRAGDERKYMQQLQALHLCHG